MNYKKYFKMILSRKHYIHWLNQFMLPYRVDLSWLMAITILLPVSAIGSAVVSKYLIDCAIAKNTHAFKTYLLYFILLQILGLIVGSYNTYITTRIRENLTNHLQYLFLEKYFHIDWLESSQYATGDITTRLTSDVQNIVNYYVVLLPNIVALFIEFTLSFVILVWFDPWLAIFGFVLGPVIAFLSLTWGHKIKRIQSEIQKNEGRYRSYYIEAIKHHIILKTFESQHAMLKRIQDFQSQKVQLVLQKNTKIILANLIIGSSTRISLIAAFTWGAFRIASDAISFGTFTAFLQLFSKVQYPLLNLSKLMPQLIQTLTSIERYLEIEHCNDEKLTPSTSTFKGSIGLEIRDLSFRYAKDKPVLKNLNFVVPPGAFVSIIGPSGVGKTTLMRLILELIKPCKGSIHLYNESEKIDASRSYFSYVPQGNTLFSGTIRENLSIATPKATAESMYQALEIACAKSFVQELPLQLDTPLGENLLGLSEGQAQRICIARAILRNRPILLLDESTSALDQALESQIIQNIQNHLHKTTCILITHRTQVLHHLDHTYEISNYQIAKKEL